MCATVLLHVILTSEGFVAFGAEGVFLAGVFLGVTGSVAGCGEVIGAADLLGHRARILVLLGLYFVGSRRDGRHARRLG